MNSVASHIEKKKEKGKRGEGGKRGNLAEEAGSHF